MVRQDKDVFAHRVQGQLRKATASSSRAEYEAAAKRSAYSGARSGAIRSRSTRMSTNVSDRRVRPSGVDLLQIPAFLCRQTDLKKACAEPYGGAGERRHRRVRRLRDASARPEALGLAKEQNPPHLAMHPTRYHRLVNDLIGPATDPRPAGCATPTSPRRAASRRAPSRMVHQGQDAPFAGAHVVPEVAEGWDAALHRQAPRAPAHLRHISEASAASPLEA